MPLALLRPDRRAGPPMPRLRLMIAAAVIVPALLCLAASWYDRVRLLRQATAEATSIRVALREHALRMFNIDAMLLDRFNRVVQGLSWEQIRAQSGPITAEIGASLRDQPQISAIALTDALGRSWVANQPLAGAGYLDVSDREYFAAQRAQDRGIFVSRPYIGLRGSRRSFGISERITRPGGGFDGIVHVGMDVGYFTAFWADVLAGRPGAAVALMRDDGVLLARFPALQGQEPDGGAAAGIPAGGTRVAVSRLDRVERIQSSGPIGSYGLQIGVGLSTAEVLATWWEHVVVLGLICAAAAAALVLAARASLRQAQRLYAAEAARAAYQRAAQDGQRLELMGQLAAGVAHDLANIVQAVLGGARLIERGADQADRVRTLAHLVGEAAERAAALTRRMLDFARREQAGEGERGAGRSDPAGAAADACQLLARMFAQSHRLRITVMNEGLPAAVLGDRFELEAAIMNLACNARDAMPEGGEVAVEVAGEQVGHEPRGETSGLAPGRYARISVIDSGIGMTKEVLARAAEPFFTTKPRGKGTGLGLSGARGFAESVGGRLALRSEPGKGTVVSFWLPEAPPEADTATLPRVDPRKHVVLV